MPEAYPELLNRLVLAAAERKETGEGEWREDRREEKRLLNEIGQQRIMQHGCN